MPSGLHTGILFSLQSNLPVWLWSLCALGFRGDQLRNGRAGAWTAGSPNSLQAGVDLIHSRSIPRASLVSADECQQSKSTRQKKNWMETILLDVQHFLRICSYCHITVKCLEQSWLIYSNPDQAFFKPTTAKCKADRSRLLTFAKG